MGVEFGGGQSSGIELVGVGILSGEDERRTVVFLQLEVGRRMFGCVEWLRRV